MDAIYARQSVDKADSISVESQIEYCLYETRGAPYCVFSDKGYSGKNTDRPDFRRMLQKIRQGKIQRVICYKLDRCSRSILDFSMLMDEFQQYGVTFVSCTERFDTSTPMGRAMLNICVVFAQLERETIQQRVRDAYVSRSQKGFYMGGRIPFGFGLEEYVLNGKRTSRYCEEPKEAQLLRSMYDIYLTPTASLGDVVNELQHAGIRHPRKEDGQWIRSNIGRMLRNPIYVKADMEIYRYFQKKGVVITSPPEEFTGIHGCYLFSERLVGESVRKYLVIAPHEGIIDAKTWLRCVQKSKTNRASVKGGSSSWLVGKLKCAKCGGALVISKTVRKNQNTYRYIICPRSRGAGKNCEGVQSLRAEDVEKLVAEKIIEILCEGRKHICFNKVIPDLVAERNPEPSKVRWEQLSVDQQKKISDLVIRKIFLSNEEMSIHWRIRL